MLFNSLQFAFFFPIVTALYFLLPHRLRWALLLSASCLFYAAFIPQYLLVLFFLIAVDYVAGIWIEGAEGERRKKFLLASLVSNIGILAIFKYLDFFNANLRALAGFLDWNYPIGMLGIILPIGLSFHTFQSLSYTIEVYRGRQKAERHPGIFALYVMFYPQLVAGPIERPYNLLHQFYEKHSFDYARVTNGLKLMAWGLFKKVVIADRLADFVNPIFNQPTAYEGIPLILAAIFFGYQIYCDFSGYSDIAIGAAQVMGFRLMQNFNRPYAASSIADFWRRWHISLSTWFRDYLYFPLGGNRVGKLRWHFNLLITFLVSGLWHGASWTFVIWGGLHGAYLIVAQSFDSLLARLGVKFNPNDRLARAAQIVITFALVSFAWIFFRASTFQDALYISTHLFTGISIGAPAMQELLTYLNMAKIGILAILVMEIAYLFWNNAGLRARLSSQPAWLRWSAYYALMMSILLFGKFSESKFIYFQF
ncbi:MAG: MBOAT family protein [Chloroflexi bacterium]|nr:MBOAT family protein [Chloroflexota bacterium]